LEKKQAREKEKERKTKLHRERKSVPAVDGGKRKRERREKTRAVVGLEAVPFQPEMAVAMEGVGRRWWQQIKPSDPTWYASPSSS
jgi:hypothetical protein